MSSLLRESRFYVRPPGEFVDDLINAAGDYIGFGCDELEKAISQQVVKKASRVQEVSHAVDAMYTHIETQLKIQTPAFERAVFGAKGALKIPDHVVVACEVVPSSSSLGVGGVGGESHHRAEEERLASVLQQELVALQQRVASAAVLNRALRTQFAAHQADVELYATHEDSFVRTKKSTGSDAAQLAAIQSVTRDVATLRTLHTAVTEQFGKIFGEESTKDLVSAATAATAAAASASSSSTPLESSSVGGGEMTQQINLAALLADSSTAASSSSSSSAAVLPPTTAGASSNSSATNAMTMGIHEDAVNMF